MKNFPSKVAVEFFVVTPRCGIVTQLIDFPYHPCDSDFAV
jgi:hypothetical protein